MTNKQNQNKQQITKPKQMKAATLILTKQTNKINQPMEKKNKNRVQEINLWLES